MAETPGTINWIFEAIRRYRGLALSLAVAGMIFVILVPLSPAVMDVLLAANITLAVLILLTVIYVSTPLEFSVFPTVLLGATLVRLVLNIASTRLILTAGAGGAPPSECTQAAGRIIWSFSDFVTSGSLAVGVILFAIIVTIQLIVVTKGTARISEVSARFVLDAMPGRQMAIDSDLAAGLIDQETALARREQISQQADFYGAMDGASKFIRGDAAAAIVITIVNILGGMFIGMMQNGWSLSETAGLFTRLTIGDGLVTQIPALLVSVAAALLVTRSAARANLAEQVIGQLTARPVALGITAVFVVALAMTSLPKAPLLMMAVGCGGLAWVLSGRRRREEAGEDVDAREADSAAAKPRSEPQDLRRALAVDAMSIELGFALVPLTDGARDGDLLERIAALRHRLAGELGLVVPPVRIRDNMQLQSRGYVIKIRGTRIAGGQLYPNELLAVGDPSAIGEMVGRDTTDPACGTPAVWIVPAQRNQAEMMGYTVLHPTAVLVSHLGEVVRTHAASLLSRQQVATMLNELKATAADLVAEVNDKLKIGQVQKVLQNLLKEQVGIRDIERILEAACDAAERTSDISAITEHVRGTMAAALSQQYCSDDGRLWCVNLAGPLEQAIAAHYQSDNGQYPMTITPELAERVTSAVREGVAALKSRGRRPVVVCAPQARPIVREMIAPTLPQTAVLGYNEIESVDVKSVASVGTKE